MDVNILKVSPKTNGKLVALDNRTLSFIPVNAFKQDTEYRFTLDLEALFKDPPRELASMTFGIKTLKQQFNVYSNPVQSYENDTQFIEGQIRSSDQLSLATAKELLSVEHKGERVDVSFSDAVKNGTQFDFKIDSVQRFEEDSELIISWDGTKFNIDSSGKSNVVIPGKNNFSVLGLSVERGSEQHLLINFSDPLKKDKTLKAWWCLKATILQISRRGE